MDWVTFRVLITGPNTVKQLRSKTAGFAGVVDGAIRPARISAGDRSLPVLDQIFADIGDEQSLTRQSLSAFSSLCGALSKIYGRWTTNGRRTMDDGR